ncbi:MAG: hypothetical protein IJZ89_04450 [Clostridia bacterium]|nr:hypothetical protein [Clostridia bacterium]
MKLLVAGSRSIKNIDLSKYIVGDIELIITGGAKGIDEIAEKYADDHKLSKLVLRPQYQIYKRGAPLKRNKMMVDIADEVLILWDGKSKGSLFTIEYAKKKNKRLSVVILQENVGG